jgi:hypothetical protein
VTGQHLRPLSAFVVVAIVAGVVFANALRAQDVVDAIRGGASDVLAGTSLLHEPLYVVERGEQIEAAPEPEVDSSVESGSVPLGPVGESTPSTAAPVPTPAAGSDAGTGPTGQAGQAAGTGKAGDEGGSKGNGVPVTPKAGNHQGHGAPGGGEDSAGTGGGATVGQATEGHGNGHAGEDHGKGPGRNQVAQGHGRGHAGDKGHDASNGHGPKGHAKADHGKSDRGDSDHGQSNASPAHPKNKNTKNDGAKKTPGQGQARGHSRR